ncbi:MAG TPA: glycine zipper family protein [Cellvibrio sp.]|nr:glycine zipper family protein [Cellvibrio sp.]
MRNSFKFVTSTALLVIASVAVAQTPPSKSLSTSIGVMVFPAKGQTAQKQSQDEGECFTWSKNQTGYDPMNPSASAPQQTQAAPAPVEQQGGQRLRGAVRGAAAGAVIGEVANDDASDGAKVGATLGVLRGGAESRRQKADAEHQAAQQQQQVSQQQQAVIQEQASLFNKGFGACLESKGYTVK